MKKSCTESFLLLVIWVSCIQGLYAHITDSTEIHKAISLYETTIMHYQQRSDSAILFGRKALPLLMNHKLWEKAVETQLIVGYFMGRIGESDSMLHYYRLGKKNAKKFLGESHSLYGNAVANESRSFMKRGEYKACISTLEKALKIEKASAKPSIYLIDNYMKSIAAAYLQMGDIEEAIAYYDQILNRSYILNEQSEPGIASYHIYYLKARALEKKNDHSGALQNRKACLLAHKEEQMTGKKVNYLPYLFIHLDLAVSYLKLGFADSAAHYLNQVEKVVKPSDYYGKASIQYTYGLYFLEIGAYASAEKAILTSLEGIKKRSLKKGEDPDVGRTLNLLGRALSGQKKYESALHNFLHGAETASGLPLSKSFQQIPEAECLKASVLVVEILQNYAKTALEQYKEQSDIQQLTLAHQAWQRAVALVPRIRKEIFAEGSRLFFSEKLIPLLEQAIHTADLMFRKTGDRSYLDSAYSYAELSRLSLLYENLQATSAKHQIDLPAEFQDKIEHYEAQASRYQRQIKNLEPQSDVDSLRIKRWENKLFEVRESQKKLMQQIERDYPAYYQLKYDFQLVSATDVRRYLDKTDASLLQYFWGEKDLYIFLLDPKQIRLEVVPGDSLLIQDILNLHKRLQKPSTAITTAKGRANYQSYIETSKKLFDRLIPPGLTLPDHLIIAPDGWLGYIPFELLLTDHPQIGSDYRALPYLLRESAVRYIFSSTIMMSSQPQLREISRNYAGFAPSFGEDDISALATSVRTGNVPDLLPLVYNQDEVRDAFSVMGGDSWLGKDATEARFKAEAPHSRILHLSLHAFTDDTRPLQSGLAFYRTSSMQTNEPGKELNEGILYAHELYQMSFASELAVLSACHTGRGKMQRGEGIMSLARAFRYAGCPSIVMSLWETEGAAARMLVSRFFELLDQGMDKAAALRQAKLDYLDQAPPSRTDPYLWSNLVLIGDGEPQSKGDHWPVWIGVISLLSLVLIGAIWRLA